MATPRPTSQLLSATKFASPSASIRSLSQLLEVRMATQAPEGRMEAVTSRRRCRRRRPPPTALPSSRSPFMLQDDSRTPMASAFSSRPASGRTMRSGSGGGGEQPTPQLQPPQQQLQHHQQLQSLLAARESEAALLRQQLQQLTADFKFNLQVCGAAAKCCGVCSTAQCSNQVPELLSRLCMQQPPLLLPAPPQTHPTFAPPRKSTAGGTRR